MRHLLLIFVSCFAIAAVGCGDKKDKDHDHDHEKEHHSHDGDHDHDHDHDGDHDKDGEHEAHGHANDAQYGGTMNEIGEHVAWVEVLVDNEDATLTVWFWDAHVENPLRLNMNEIVLKTTIADKDVTLKLEGQADELTGETVGNTQRFLVKDARLKGLESLEATLTKVEAKGSTFHKVAIRWAE